jgi:hypothetical protein
VVTYATPVEPDSEDAEDDAIDEDEFPIVRPTMTMN